MSKPRNTTGLQRGVANGKLVVELEQDGVRAAKSIVRSWDVGGDKSWATASKKGSPNVDVLKGGQIVWSGRARNHLEALEAGVRHHDTGGPPPTAPKPKPAKANAAKPGEQPKPKAKAKGSTTTTTAATAVGSKR